MALFLLIVQASAQLQWDTNVITGGAQGGTGDWIFTNFWTDGINNIAWVDSSTATFWGTAGTVTVNGAVTATGLSFLTNGYTIAGTSPLTLGGAAPAVAVPATATTVTISAALGGSAGLTKTGAGTLVLSGANTFTSALAINGGTVSVSDLADIGVASPLGAGGSVSLDGGTLTFNFGGTDSTNRPIVLNANGGTFNSILGGGGVQNITLSGVISGTGGLTKTGTGVLRLIAANTFTGPVTVKAAFIEVPTVTNSGVPGPLGAGSNITIDGGAILIPGFGNHSTDRAIFAGIQGATFSPGNGTLALSGPITGPGTFATTGNGVILLSGTNTFAGDVFISSSIVRLANGQAIPDTAEVFLGGSPNPPKILDLDNSNETIGSLRGGDETGGNVMLGTGTLTIGGDNSSKDYAGSISGTGGVVKIGTGIQNLSGASTFTGLLSIRNGAISTPTVADAGLSSPLGAGNSLVLGALGTAGKLLFTSLTDGATTRAITLDGNGGEFVVNEVSSTLNLNGTISGTGGLTKSGAGTLFISGTVSYTGPTIVSEGILALAGTVNTAGGGITVAAGTALQARNVVNRAISGAGAIVATGGLFIGDSTSASGFAFDGALDVGTNDVALRDADTAQLGTSTTIGAGGRLLSSNGITLASGRTVTASTAASARISGKFVNDGTITGPIVAGRELTFDNNVSGIGSYGGNVRFSGNFSPGNGGPAAVALNSFSLVDTTTLSLEIGGLTPGTEHDQLSFTGIGVLDGALNIELIGGFQPVEGDTFVVINGGTLSGAFDVMNLPGLVPGLFWNYVQSANSTTLVVIPEPSGAALLATATVALVARRRRCA
jgi:autotransporter-associated beta strand protein